MHKAFFMQKNVVLLLNALKKHEEKTTGRKINL